MNDPKLQIAEKFVNASQYQEAQAVLAKVLLENQDNEKAWLLMAQASAGNPEKI